MTNCELIARVAAAYLDALYHAQANDRPEEVVRCQGIWESLVRRLDVPIRPIRTCRNC